MICSMYDCQKSAWRRGFCSMHYTRLRRHGDPNIRLADVGGKPRPIADRFWSFVNKNGPVPEYAPELGPCWIWTGSHGWHGYASIWVGKGVTAAAHRVSYELNVGPIPAGLHIDHLCRVRHCVNPAHLEAVTLAENILRGFGATALNARKTHCKRGHEFTDENTRILRNGGRQCRACDALREATRVRPTTPRLLLTHCHNGHPYDDENTYIKPNGKRACRECAAECRRRYDEKRRPAVLSPNGSSRAA